MKKSSFGPLNIANLKTLDAFISTFSRVLEAGDIVAFSGPVGVGKTTCVKAVLAQMNPETIVSSPSYALINQYPGYPLIYHMDWYRLEKSTDLAFLDIDHYFSNTSAITLVEWADKFPSYLPKHAIEIQLLFSEKEGERYLSVKSPVSKYKKLKVLLSAWQDH